MPSYTETARAQLADVPAPMPRARAAFLLGYWSDVARRFDAMVKRGGGIATMQRAAIEQAREKPLADAGVELVRAAVARWRQQAGKLSALVVRGGAQVAPDVAAGIVTEVEQLAASLDAAKAKPMAVARAKKKLADAAASGWSWLTGGLKGVLVVAGLVALAMLARNK